jgi:trans-aconitate 2-methyltransferase
MSFEWDGSKYATVSDLQAEVGHVLIDGLHLQPDERVLDIGCGLGNLTAELAVRCHQGFVLGIDASPSMIQEAQKRYPGSPTIEFRMMDAQHIEFRRAFDVVFSNSALHWIPQSQKFLVTIHKALKPGGRIGFQFPLLNEHHPLIAHTRQVIRSLALEGWYRTWAFPWFVTTAQDYQVLLQTAGYRNISVTEPHTTFRFGTASQAYAFFDAVGLALYLAPLEADQKQRFKQELLQTLESVTTGEGILLHFERLFVFASATAEPIAA